MNATTWELNKVIESFCEWTFPLQAALGIGGNSITLLVLLSRPMRSSTNTMLALAAMCDMLYLVFMCPNQMSRWPSIVQIKCRDNKGNLRKCFSEFAHFYLRNKTHFTFLVNWFSAASTWLIVSVSFDRLWAIKSPFSARSMSGCTKKDCVIIPMIFIFTCAISFHMNFSFEVTGAETGQSKMVSVQNSAVLYVFTMLNLVMHILIPMLLLITLNACLLYYLRNRRQMFEPRTRSGRSSTRSDETPAPLLAQPTDSRDRVVRNHSSNSGMWCRHMGKAERHVTVTVTAIVTAYLVSHLPSALIYAYIYFVHYDAMYGKGWMYTLVAVSSTVVTCSKVANFLLFCMSSKHFRIEMQKKLCFLCRHRETMSLKDSFNQQRTRSLPLNIIGDSTNNASPE
ncbi:unnamed protein product [Caenorhabditis auriculariae]|uniref:G-protein coupled receptors family 1 profile domain-containing protein n=1 Tax=Caenorhabditis auriculariae TaxID=2777116 RepID=A0A8S1H7R3_9PELO|nr:unnamed protein product [Caenorhabditis auriculariae]